jgi:hypothetical protein
MPSTPPAAWDGTSYDEAPYDSGAGSAAWSRELSDAFAAHTLDDAAAQQQGEQEAFYERDEAYAEQDEGAYGEAEGAEGDAGAAFAPGEVIWRAGDALDDEEEEGEEEEEEEEGVTFALSEEWAARFAQTEHRRAQRACALTPCGVALLCCAHAAFAWLTRHAVRRSSCCVWAPAGKQQARAGGSSQQHAADAARAASGRVGGDAAASPAGPPPTVVDLVRAAGAGAVRPDAGARALQQPALRLLAAHPPFPDACSLVLRWCAPWRAARYGAAGAARVAALEAAQQARYERALAAGKVLVWPCEPLRSVP